MQVPLGGCLTPQELFVQSATYVPSTVRGVREGPFGIDFWRLQGSKDWGAIQEPLLQDCNVLWPCLPEL